MVGFHGDLKEKIHYMFLFVFTNDIVGKPEFQHIYYLFSGWFTLSWSIAKVVTSTPESIVNEGGCFPRFSSSTHMFDQTILMVAKYAIKKYVQTAFVCFFD